MRDDVNKKAAGVGAPTAARVDEKQYLHYSTDFDNPQDEDEVEAYDYFNEGYPFAGYADEFEGWRDLVL